MSIDTRSLAPGDLFVALTAARDGHDFVAEALAKGAAAALVSRRPEGVAADAPLLVVPDVLDGLRALGRAARARFAGRVVAVTGSVGKTGTKEMFRAALAALGSVHAAEKSFNNHWGVPLTLARMPADRDFAVIEVGMNAPGEIAPLARLARPHLAMVTTVEAVHMAAFRDIRGIAREKAAIFAGLEAGRRRRPQPRHADLSDPPRRRAPRRRPAGALRDDGAARVPPRRGQGRRERHLRLGACGGTVLPLPPRRAGAASRDERPRRPRRRRRARAATSPAPPSPSASGRRRTAAARAGRCSSGRAGSTGRSR